ncbi:MAG: acetate uptake transporter [Corynebacterium sp.]|nr:acetate uptake transporter [Corynebacterium sp.]
MSNNAPVAHAPSVDPGPLGLAAFATTTFLLSLFNAGLLPGTAEAVVLPVALFYGGIAQLLAGMWEFACKNTFGATAFTSFGAFWLSFWGLLHFYVPEIPEAERGAAIGWFLVLFGIVAAILLVAVLGTSNTILKVTFILLVIAFACLAGGDLFGATGLTRAGGWMGMITAISAFYGSAAGVINATWGRKVIPA